MTSNLLTKTLNTYVDELSLSMSAQTVSAYQYDIARFVEWLCERGVKRMPAIKAEHIVGYLSYCKKMGKSDASVNRYYMSIKGFCKHLRRNRIIERDWTEDISAPKIHLKAPRIPTLDEIKRILQAPDTSTEEGCRDRAILELLYSSGLRASELCELELHDVGQDNVIIRCGKRSKTRTIPITKEAANWIQQYITSYRGNDEGYLFVTLEQRKAILRQNLCKLVVRYAECAGVESVTTHTLRHACATHLLDEGADLRLIQEVLGHSSIASTQRYTHLSSVKIKDMFTQFHPRR